MMKTGKITKKLLIYGSVFLLIFSLFTSISLNVSAEETELFIEEWVAIYSGSGTTLERAKDIAVDQLGNVYVTGFGYIYGAYDIITIAYGPSGNILWEATYNGPANGNDYGEGIVVGSNGHIYVTGESMVGKSNFDYITIAYDPQGNQQWLAIYNGKGPGEYSIEDITIDSNDNIYLTGISNIGSTSDNIVTIKYDSSGILQWSAFYSSHKIHIPHAMAVDSQGNVYITGYTFGGDSKPDYLTIKYDINGKQLWEVEYDGNEKSQNYANDIVLDSSGNIYVTGKSLLSGIYYDYFTIAYDSSGGTLWEARYDGPGNSHDYAMAITSDLNGNIYVTGYSMGSGTSFDISTVAYNSAGNQLWVARYNGPGNSDDVGYDLAVDPFGNVIVTGLSFGSGTSYDSVTIAYDSLGNQLWLGSYNGPENKIDYTSVIAIDPMGNIYVTGASVNSASGYDYLTIKYSISPISGTQNIIENIEQFNLEEGTETSLVSKLENAIKSIINDRPSALGQLEAFINEVEALRGNKLTTDQADELIADAQLIIDNINN